MLCIWWCPLVEVKLSAVWLHLWHGEMYREKCIYLSNELFQYSQEGYFGIYFLSCEVRREINTKITLEWAPKQFVMRVHTLLYILHNIVHPQMTIKRTIIAHRPRVSLIRVLFSWWRHNRLLITSQWPDNCDAITSIMISNSWDIDFIHGYIHGRLCKKTRCFISRSNDECRI